MCACKRSNCYASINIKTGPSGTRPLWIFIVSFPHLSIHIDCPDGKWIVSSSDVEKLDFCSVSQVQSCGCSSGCDDEWVLHRYCSAKRKNKGDL